MQRLLQLMPRDWPVIKRDGFSLVEVILSLSIFILLATALTGTVIYGQESTVLSGKRAQAVFLAEEGLEAARNIRDDDFARLIDGTYGLQIVGGAWNIAGSSDATGIFTRQITISTVNSNTKKVTASVTWQQNLQRQGSVSLDTYLTYWMKPAANQGAGLLINSNSVNTNPSDNTQIIGLTLQNNGLTDIIINQIRVSWTGAPASRKAIKINNIAIDGNSVWSGSANSGDLLTVTSFTLPVGATVHPINFLDFSQNMTGATITLDFIMADGSTASATFSPGVTTDTLPPSAVANLSSSNPTSNSIDLSWTAPGDDGNTGTAASYDIRYATSPINDSNWATALQLTGEPIPQASGSLESLTVNNLSPSTTYYFALKTSDEVPNISALSNITSNTTLAPSVDAVPPSAVTDLSATNPTANSINLSWTAPGDDGNTGTAASYDIRYATSPISDANWSLATLVTGEPAPQIAGTMQSMAVSGLSGGITYYFALKTSDEAPNLSALSNVASNTTLSQANSLNVNIASVAIDPVDNKRIIGITLSNSGASDIILDKMVVSWTGAIGGTKITTITINNGLVWLGNNNSGATEDIINFTLSSAVIYPLNYLVFNKNMTGSTLSINFIMADGSTKLVSNIIP